MEPESRDGRFRAHLYPKSGPAFLRAEWPRSRASLSSGDSRWKLPVGHSRMVLWGSACRVANLVSFGIMAKMAAEPEALRSEGGAPDASLPAAGHPLTGTSMGCLAPAHSAPLVGWPPLPLVFTEPYIWEWRVFFSNGECSCIKTKHEMLKAKRLSPDQPIA